MISAESCSAAGPSPSPMRPRKVTCEDIAIRPLPSPLAHNLTRQQSAAQPPALPDKRPPMRERYRAQVRHEVKQAALRQLAESGPAAVSISAIGKQLGMSGPALYRYFASRDELLTGLT